ncbi:SigE family RNA polymerase sigma factor [Streptomyces sp. NL15-2K]|uniref:SigE family RNA polymerase sigma factor n=1 Tax=Streptomyces sp. NL15-2K TaxID=376149 RepID=UPI000F57F8B1|nr:MULTISPECIES: SigE family RNA polymerase sigma factor [Actinomycetes]WKX08160.1 SigE family RNA polymerase sigma factor [Kutzneria buriramensis]GCB50384.1 RNA polymerase ECF-subfamily sigma factor [Streptomyces sp. NL15-2K]
MDAEAQESFREFVANRSSALLKTAVLLSGGDRHAGEDLLQNALIKAAGRWHRIDEPEAYVRQILYRQQVSRWRLKWPRRELSVAEPPETGADADASSAADLRLVMRGALARLTARQRTVLVLLPHSRLRSSGGTPTFEDLPEADVARILGCSVGTVRSTAHRSLARLRALAPELAALGPDSGARQQPSRDSSPAEVL